MGCVMLHLGDHGSCMLSRVNSSVTSEPSSIDPFQISAASPRTAVRRLTKDGRGTRGRGGRQRPECKGKKNKTKTKKVWSSTDRHVETNTTHYRYISRNPSYQQLPGCCVVLRRAASCNVGLSGMSSDSVVLRGTTWYDAAYRN